MPPPLLPTLMPALPVSMLPVPPSAPPPRGLLPLVLLAEQASDIPNSADPKLTQAKAPPLRVPRSEFDITAM
jgi:hypothetical protein